MVMLHRIMLMFILIMPTTLSFMYDWNATLVESTVPNTTTVADLNSLRILSVHGTGCLTDVSHPTYSVNKYTTFTNHHTVLPGVSFYINEHMAVGHGMYDYAVIQALSTGRVARIVSQRAPCAQSDLCIGLGTWKSWYSGFYGAAINAFSSGKVIPVYFRFESKTSKLSPHILSIGEDGNLLDVIEDKNYPVVDLGSNLFCSESIIVRRPESRKDGVNVLSIQASEKFKETAYKYLGENRTAWYEKLDAFVVNQTASFALHDYISPNINIRKRKLSIVFGYREKGIRRSCEDPEVLIDYLYRKLPLAHYDIHALQLFNSSYNFQYQIALVTAADVFISEHGAFQSNVMYMRRNTLMIDLYPKFAEEVSHYHEWVARNSGVYMKHLLLRHNETNAGEDDFYRFDEQEMNEIVTMIEQYHAHFWKSHSN